MARMDGAISAGDFRVVDDGTYWIFYGGSSKIFKVRKSDGQLLLAGGVDTDVTL